MAEYTSKIEQTIAHEDWKSLVKIFSPKDIVECVSYTQAMHIVGYLTLAAAYEMEYDGPLGDLMRNFSVDLMLLLRENYPKEWNEDWKNEAFLGISCAFVYREEEAYKYCKSAYEKLEDPPQSLIFAYISSGKSSDHFLGQKDIIELTNRAIKKGITSEAALRMASLAFEAGDQKTVSYWEQKAREAEVQGVHTPLITPNIIKNLLEIPEGYQNEE